MPLPRCPKCARSTRAPELVTDDLWERITKEVVGQAPAAPAGMPAPEAPRLARRRTLLRWVGFSSPQALDYKRRTTGTVLAKAPALTPTGIVSDPLLTRWRKMAVRRFGWPSFFYALPARLVYFCAMRVWGEATSGVYGTTVVGTLSMSDAIRRFARIHAIPGHGKDEHHDSNRGRAQL